VLDTLHDYAQAYLDGKLVGTLDRRKNESRLPLSVTGKNTKLDILVENTGRVNFTTVLRGERKGILGGVTLAGQHLPDGQLLAAHARAREAGLCKQPCSGACFYRATFTVDKPADTFLDTSAFTKGQVWLNGHALGRVWNIGPQKALYVPGPWLKAGQNEVVVSICKANQDEAYRAWIIQCWMLSSEELACIDSAAIRMQLTKVRSLMMRSVSSIIVVLRFYL